MKISIIVPMYNENSIIAETANTLSRYMSCNFDDYEMIFVSDGSTDGCDRTVSELKLNNTEVISYSPNCGKGYAVRQGMLASTGDIAMFIDADLAYGTDVIKKYQTYLSRIRIKMLLLAPEQNTLRDMKDTPY